MGDRGPWGFEFRPKSENRQNRIVQPFGDELPDECPPLRKGSVFAMLESGATPASLGRFLLFVAQETARPVQSSQEWAAKVMKPIEERCRDAPGRTHVTDLSTAQSGPLADPRDKFPGSAHRSLLPGIALCFGTAASSAT